MDNRELDSKELEELFGYSEAELDAMAEPFGQSSWPEGRTKLLGRPRLTQEEIRVVSTKMSVSELELIDKSAQRAGVSRSQFIRDACRSAVAIALEQPPA